MCKRWLSVVLVLAFLICSVPLSAAAEDIVIPSSATTEPSADDSAPSEAYILHEIENKREVSTKHFRMSDGTFMAVQYDLPVHFEDENGVWQQYDNTLTETADNIDYQNTRSDKDIRLSKKAKQHKMVQLTANGYPISWGYEKVNNSAAEYSEPAASASPEALTGVTQEVRYREVYPSVDLQYFLLPTGVKENIVLTDRNAQHTFVQQYDIGHLTAVQTDAQTIALRDSDGETVYTIAAPVMTDAAAAVSTAVTLSITKTNGNHITVRLTADSAWLTAPERVYPVLLDPQVQQEIKSTTDNHCYIARPSSGMDLKQSIGYVYVGTWSAGLCRAFIKPILPELKENEIPVKAMLTLRSTGNEFSYHNDTNAKLDLYELTQDWTISTVSYDQSHDSNILDYQIVGVNNNYAPYTWDITRAAKKWLKTGNNCGLMLESSAQTNCIPKLFYTFSRENAALHPSVTVYYVDTTGLNGFNSYKTLDYGTYGALHVNEYRRTLTYTFEDVSYSGSMTSLNLYHVYNSDWEGESSAYGSGWRLNLSQTIGPADYGDGIAEGYDYVYTDEDGTKIYFRSAGTTDRYEDEIGQGLTMTFGPADWYYTIEDKYGNRKGFDSNGRLKVMTDADGNIITLTYDSEGRLSMITDNSGDLDINDGVEDSGRSIVLVYYGGLLDYVMDSAGRCHYYHYNHATDNLKSTLKRVERHTGENPAFVMNGNKLSKVYLGGSYLAITYDGKGLCQSLANVPDTSQSGNRFMYLESIGDTTRIFTHLGPSENISGSDRILEYCVFNEWGQKITSYLKKPNGEILEGVSYNRYQQSENLKANNKLLQSSSSQNAVNLLSDTSFENGGYWNTIYWSSSTPQASYFGVETDASNAFIGQKSARISATTALGPTTSFYKDLTGLSAGTYTLSGYVKTENLQGPLGAFVCGSIYYTDGTPAVDYYSPYVLGTTDPLVDNGWKRISVTFTVPANNVAKVQLHAGVRYGTSGTARFDCLQLEKGSLMNDYNLLENGGFEQSGGWTANHTSTGDGIVGTTKFQGNGAYQIAGDYTLQKHIRQTVPVYGSTGDTYILSGWAKAFSVPLDENKNRDFFLQYDITYADGTTATWQDQENRISFNPYTTDWQYLSIPFRITENKQPVSVTVYAGYYQNQNNCYFDNLQLIKCSSNTYGYDDNGNLQSAITLADQSSNYQYANNELIKAVASTGTKYYNTYSKTNVHQLTASYGDGVSYQFQYDEVGNLIRTSAYASEPVHNGVYAIHTAFKNRAIDVTNALTADGTPLVSYQWNNVTDQYFRLQKIDGTDYYSIRTMLDTNKAVTVLGGGTANGTNVVISTYTGATHQQFKFVDNGKGTYRIVPRHDETKALDTWDESAANIQIWGNVQADSKGFILEYLSGGNPLQMHSQTAYTYSGQYVSSVTDTRGNTVTYGYNEHADELQSVTDAKGNVTRYENRYISADNVYSSKVFADANKNSVLDSGELYAHYRSTNGRLTSVDNNLVYYAFSYDAYGNRTRTAVGTQTLAAYTYNDFGGKLTRIDYGNGDWERYVYDELNRVGEIWTNKGHAFWFKYDKNGSLRYLEEGSTGTITRFAYDTIGRLVSAESTNGFKRSQSYDAFNRVNRLSFVRGGTTLSYQFNYDGKNRIGSVVLPTGKTVTNTFDGLNRVTARTLNTATPLQMRYTYLAGQNGSTTTLLSSLQNAQGTYTYAYDANGNITSISKNGTLLESYTYDHLNQLTSVTDANGNVYAYTYNVIGNLQSVSLNGTVIQSYGYTDTNWRDKLTSFNGQTITYDAIGNPINYRDGIVFNWKYGRALEYFDNAQYSIFYRQNVDDYRVEKHITDLSSNTTTAHYYDYNGENVVCERWDNNTLWFLRDESGSPVGLTYNGAAYYYIKNLQGDITGLADASGTLIAQYTYDAWGKPLTVTDASGNDISANTSHIANINPLRYRGYYYDAETGLYDNHNQGTVL